jgi:hypothetical protein
VHEHTGGEHGVRREEPVDDFLGIRDGDLAGSGGERVEVPRSKPVDEVALRIGAPGAHKGAVGKDRPFEQVVAAVEPRGRLAFGHRSTDAGGGTERGSARAAGPQPLGQRALRHELGLQWCF